MIVGLSRPSMLRPRRRRADEMPLIPADPKRVLSGPLDPSIEALRSTLQPHRRRLWLRRIVRRTWLAVAAIAVGEAALWSIARLVPLEAAPIVGGGRVLGVIELLNKHDGAVFNAGDQTLLNLMCRFAGELLYTLIRGDEEQKT